MLYIGNFTWNLAAVKLLLMDTAERSGRLYPGNTPCTSPIPVVGAGSEDSVSTGVKELDCGL